MVGNSLCFTVSMNESLIIDITQIPEEGMAFHGQLDSSVFDLPHNEAKPCGALEYKLWAQKFDQELLLTGSLSIPFELICVITLKSFLKTIRLEDVAISLEIGNHTIFNVTEALREEVLIELPIHPRCDEGDVPEPCELDSRYLAVDKLTENGLFPPSRDEEDKRWSALNEITGLTDHP